MDVREQIDGYIDSQPEPKRADMQALDRLVLSVMPGCKLWFLDGTDDSGKTVSNPNIGYGLRMLHYADVANREFYQDGLSAQIRIWHLCVQRCIELRRQASNEPGAYAAATTCKAIAPAWNCSLFKALKDINVDRP